MSTITPINSTDLITNSRTDINNNFANLNTDKIETSVIDTDTTLAANSDSKIPSQKAVKAYVDSGGNSNASTTQKGLVEIATQAEFDAGTATGGTGATLAVTPALYKAGTTPVIRVYPSSGSPATWSKPSGLRFAIIEVLGGGGGGGGAKGNDAAAGGGGSGGYSKKIVAVGTLGSTETVTTGAGGTAGANTGTNGGTGGTTSFGAHCQATGGIGGTGSTNVAGTILFGSAGGGGGVGSGGTLNAYGTIGSIGLILTTNTARGGDGAASMWGEAGPGGANDAAGSTASNGFGAGGGGASDTDNSGGNTGGVGAPGYCVVTEYY